MPIRSIAHRVSRLTDFTKHESAAGILLFLSALTGLIWANSPFASVYHGLWHYPLVVGIGGYSIDHSVHHWINDGLMAMFFFLIGLEIKRECIAGELRAPRNAVLPLVAALGGMIVPALIYFAFNPEGAAAAGWGIPMATDIAFALGILSLLGPRVPLALKVFLTVLAIADDIGAVLVIALFYTADISLSHLGIGGAALAVLLVANYCGVRSSLFYGAVGIGGVWLAFLLSGVHATIAGILAALTIPARATIDERSIIKSLTTELQKFREIRPNDNPLLEPEQYQSLERMKKILHAGDTPLQRLEHALHPLVTFVVLPLFALANAGITLDLQSQESFFHPITVGVGLGLLLGKVVGVVGACLIATTLRISKLPDGIQWTTVVGVGLLAGIGFTMSLFVSNLSFLAPAMGVRAKLGILPASLFAGIVGYLVLRVSLPHRENEETNS